MVYILLEHEGYNNEIAGIQKQKADEKAARFPERDMPPDEHLQLSPDF